MATKQTPSPKKSSKAGNGSSAPTYRSRIVGFEQLRPSQIDPHPKNWRMHPKAQLDALDKTMKAIGMTDAVKVRKLPNGRYQMIDGHLREELNEQSDSPIPALILDLDDLEADRALLTHDAITGMAEVNAEMLQQLIGDAKLPDIHVDVDALFNNQSRATPDYIEIEPPDAVPGNPIMRLNLEARFDSDLPYNIPAFREDRLYVPEKGVTIKTWSGSDTDWEKEDGPNIRWFYVYNTSGGAVLPKERSIVTFYVDDSAFEQLWSQTDKYVSRMLHFGFSAAVSPNFSTYINMPLAQVIWNTYRARWVGRYFQEAGMRIIPDVNFAKARDYDITFSGIPEKAPLISFQVQTLQIGSIEEENCRNGVIEAVKRLKPERVLVYGEPKRVTSLFQDQKWFKNAIVQPSWTTERRRTKFNNVGNRSLRQAIVTGAKSLTTEGEVPAAPKTAKKRVPK